LVGGKTEFEGRVEVKCDEEWGTVCDDRWDDNDARVVCRQLGFHGDEYDAHALSHARFGQGSGGILLDNVYCTGSEWNIGLCWHNPWGESSCDHTQDASVVCATLPGK